MNSWTHVDRVRHLMSWFLVVFRIFWGDEILRSFVGDCKTTILRIPIKTTGISMESIRPGCLNVAHILQFIVQVLTFYQESLSFGSVNVRNLSYWYRFFLSWVMIWPYLGVL